MSRNLFAGILVLLLALGGLAACDKSTEQQNLDGDDRDSASADGPKAVAEKYLDAIIALNIEEAYKYVSAEIKVKYPIEKVVAQNNKLMSNSDGWIMKLISKRSVTKIGEVSIEGDAATVSYSLFTPDIKPVIEDATFVEMLRTKIKNGEDISKLVEERLDSDNANTERIERSLTMIRENGVWKVNSFS